MASHDSCTRFYQVRSTQAGRQRIKKTGPIYSRGGSNIVSQAGRRQPSNDARSKAAVLYVEPGGLWRDAVRNAPGSAIAHCNYGVFLADGGEAAEAAAQFREAIRL